MKFSARLLSALVLAAALGSAAVAGEGKVLRTVNTDMYTYAEVEQNGQAIWIAGPAVALKPESQVRFEDGPMMANFHSKQLQRTFPSIMFVDRIVVSAEK